MPKKSLRFAALIRVSTEKQEKKGESLGTQKTSNIQAVETMEGKIVAWYGGQEHATPGYEKKEVDRFLEDAKKNKFDAVIIAYADRWSRDNAKSKEGLEILRKNDIRFFVGTSEYDLFDPQCRMMLGLSAEFGEFQASMQKKKSIESRIHRAERGIPTVGKLPYGREYDSTANKWSIDPTKHKIIKDIAKRYLNGESLAHLAKEYGINHANLNKVLRHRCGDKWEQRFVLKDFKIDKTVPITIPRLLDEKTIRAIRLQSQANKTYERGHSKHKYLLGRMVFCSHCGYTMSGQTTNHNGHRYYRHAPRVKCSDAGYKAWVRAEELEAVVIRHLFECFGNPVAVTKAINKATPNLDKVNEMRERLVRINSEIEKIENARNRVLSLISQDTITEEQAKIELNKLSSRESDFNKQLAQLEENLRQFATPEEIKARSKMITDGFRKYSSPRLTAKKRHANSSLEAMTWAEQHALAKMVFSGKTDEGKRLGIFVRWIDGQANRRRKRWDFDIQGHFIQAGGYAPMDKAKMDAVFTFGAAEMQKDLVNYDASHSLSTTLLEFLISGEVASPCP